MHSKPDDFIVHSPAVFSHHTTPFALANREEDYKIAWEFFKGGKQP